MAIPNRSIQSNFDFGAICDWGIVLSLCTLIFVLPASIAILDSFAGLAVFFYLLKKIYFLAADWPAKTASLDLIGKVRFSWRGFYPPQNILDRPLQLLVAAFFISVLFSHYPSLSFLAFMGKFIKCVFLYFCCLEAFSKGKFIRIFFAIFMLSALVTSFNGAFQHYTGRDLIKGHCLGMEHLVLSQRINSTFASANGLGAYLLPVIGLVIHFLHKALVRKRSVLMAGIWGLFLVLLLACLCWTYSRSSWIGYLSILFAMVVLDRRKVFFAATLFLVCILIFLPSLSKVRHMHLIRDQETSVQDNGSFKSMLEQGGSGRFTFWKKAISIIRTSPIWGTGLNTYGRILKLNPDIKTWWYAHNCYLQLTAETGVIGLAAFLWMLFVLLKNGLYHCYHINDLWQLTMLQGVVSGLFGFLVHSFFDNTFYTVQLGVLMWLLFGLMVSLMRLRTNAQGVS